MIKVIINFPGRMIEWKGGRYRTPVPLNIENERELDILKMMLRHYAIDEKYLIIEKPERKIIKSDNVKKSEAMKKDSKESKKDSKESKKNSK